jgi:hypothetical protein
MKWGPEPADHMTQVAGAGVKKWNLNHRAHETREMSTSSGTFAVAKKLFFTVVVVPSVTRMTGHTTRHGAACE